MPADASPQNCSICSKPVEAGRPHRQHCRAWAFTPDGQRVVCTLDLTVRENAKLPHRGEHASAAWRWRTGETPTRHEKPALRRADVDDLPALCRELAALAEAVDVAVHGRLRSDRSQVRRVPGTRPPLDLHALEVSQALASGVRATARELRTAHGHTTGYRTLALALADVPTLVDSLGQEHPLRRRVPAVLAALRDRARRLAEWDRDWLVLGECPQQWADEPVDVLTRDGLVLADTGCWSPDVRATAAAAARGEDAQILRRSLLAIPRDADPLRQTIVCRACGYTCTPEDRAADVVLASGRDLVLPARKVAHMLAVPESTLHTWRRRGVVAAVGDSKPPVYSVAAVAQVVVARRRAGKARVA